MNILKTIQYKGYEIVEISNQKGELNYGIKNGGKFINPPDIVIIDDFIYAKIFIDNFIKEKERKEKLKYFKMEVVFEIDGDLTTEQFKNDMKRRLGDFTLYNDETDDEIFIDTYKYWDTSEVKQIKL